MIVNNLMGGFLAVLGLQTVLLVSNVLSSYVSRDGTTMQEMIEQRVGA